MTYQEDINAQLDARRPVCPVCGLAVEAADEAEIDWQGESAIAHAACDPTAQAEVSTEDTDTGIYRLQPSGEAYILRFASVWEGDSCVGSVIIAGAGPLHHAEWSTDGGHTPRPDISAWCDAYLANQSRHDREDDAAWANGLLADNPTAWQPIGSL